MFHLEDNIFFQRQSNGDVRILIKKPGNLPSEIIKDVTVSAGQFASVMSSMCAFGETRETWEEACDFLERPYPGDSEAYRYWRNQNLGKSAPFCGCRGGGDEPHADHCDFWKFVLDLRKNWPGKKLMS